jgi:hypothetical protein
MGQSRAVNEGGSVLRASERAMSPENKKTQSVGACCVRLNAKAEPPADVAAVVEMQ